MNPARDGETGRFVPRLCPDPNCGGELRADVEWGRPVWACDGLTHVRDDGPLLACDRTIPRKADA